MSKASTAKVERTGGGDCSAFIDGVIWAAQSMAVDHRQGDYAEDLMRGSGFNRAELMKAQWIRKPNHVPAHSTRHAKPRDAGGRARGLGEP